MYKSRLDENYQGMFYIYKYILPYSKEKHYIFLNFSFYFLLEDMFQYKQSEQAAGCDSFTCHH